VYRITGSRPNCVEKWADKGDPVIEYPLYLSWCVHSVASSEAIAWRITETRRREFEVKKLENSNI
jgi:hypothetical protein